MLPSAPQAEDPPGSHYCHPICSAAVMPVGHNSVTPMKSKYKLRITNQGWKVQQGLCQEPCRVTAYLEIGADSSVVACKMA